MKIRCSLFAGLTCLLLAVPVFAADWMINEDYKQLDARGATDFEFLLRGDVAGQITSGGFSSVTNPFDNPTRTTSQDAFGNTIVRFAGTGSIPQDATADRHFGIFGTGKKPTVLVKAWSFPDAPTRVPVTKSNFDFLYDPTEQVLTITLENTSPDTVTFEEVGYQLSEVEHPIEALTRTGLPPESYIPLPVLDGEYAPGDSNSVVIPGVDPSAFALTYATVFFSGPSSEQDYDGTGGEWAQVAVIAQIADTIPTVSQWGLILMALLLLTAGTVILARRRRVPATALFVGLAVVLAPAAVTQADVFLLPLITPAYDDMPTVEMNGQTIVIDTGSGGGLLVTPAAAAAMGVDPATGTPTGAQGIGGAVGGIGGATTPAGVGPSGASTPITPGGQASTTPPMPAGTDIFPLPAGVDGLLGSDWLKDYNYGRVDGYFWMAKKDQGAEGIATAIAMASFLGLSPGVAVGTDGRPAGTKHGIVIPTEPREEALDGGFTKDVGLDNPSGGNLDNVPFMIKSGLPMTLITQELALELGFDLASLPTVETLGDFGTIEVLQGDLELKLFDDPDSPTFTVPVGITNPTINPFGDNILSGDILGQLPWWEVSVDENDVPFFYATDEFIIMPIPTVSEWGLIVMTLLLLVAGTIIFARRRKLQVA